MNQKIKWGIAGAVVLCVLVVAFVWGGDFASKDTEVLSGTSSPSASAEISPTASASASPSASPSVSPSASPSASAAAAVSAKPSAAATEAPRQSISPETGKDAYQTEPVPEGQPVPVEPQEVEVTDNELTCTISIRCDTLLANMDSLAPEKRALVPADGVLLAERTVTFHEGESAFNVLRRETKQNKIHLEFVNTPVFNSAYIEGIGNLYEFDCGELSGWMYKVNGWFPSYGCSRYALKDGDVVEWIYTCDLGRDIGADGGWQR